MREYFDSIRNPVFNLGAPRPDNSLRSPRRVCGEDHVGIGTDGTIPAIDDMAKFMAEFKAEVEMRRATGIGAKGERADIVTFLPDLTGPDKFFKLIDLLIALIPGF